MDNDFLIVVGANLCVRPQKGFRSGKPPISGEVSAKQTKGWKLKATTLQSFPAEMPAPLIGEPERLDIIRPHGFAFQFSTIPL